MSDAELCSRLSARLGLPLVGSAGCHDAVLAFELAPPWTARLVGSKGGGPALDSVLEAIGNLPTKVRVLALEPAGDSADGRGRVLWFAREPGPFTSYSRKEYRVLPDTLPAVLHQLAETGSTAADEEEGCGAGRDLMVCTHGSRDACCGKFGYPLYRRLTELAAASAGSLLAPGEAKDPVGAHDRGEALAPGGDGAGRIQVWRCSHLGGHRFAPTLLDLPSGRLFGRVADDDAGALLRGGSELLQRLSRLYRGRAALPEPAQIVESRLWQRSGPAFEGAALRWQVDADGSRWRVRLEGAAPDGSRFADEALVERSSEQAVATPASCGRDPETESPWSIVE